MFHPSTLVSLPSRADIWETEKSHSPRAVVISEVVIWIVRHISWRLFHNANAEPMSSTSLMRAATRSDQ